MADARFLFLHFAVLLLEFAMLLEKLIEQHHVHRFVTDGVDVALGVMGDQVGVAPIRMMPDSSATPELPMSML